jgi:hypothetical protein
VQELAAGGFKNDQKNNEILNKHYGQEWKDKCERARLGRRISEAVERVVINV